MIEKKNYKCEVVTPMFCGGSDNSKAELREQSIKGLLRFWWRAANYYKFNSVKELKNQEGKIFGSTDKGNESKSSFKIKIIEQKIATSKDKLPKFNQMVASKGRSFPINLLEYLCYGTYDYVRGSGNIFNREHIKPESKFNIEFIFIKNIYKKQVIEAFYYLAYFGGIGAKSRNGYGKFRVFNTDDEYKFETFLQNLKNNIKNRNKQSEFPIINNQLKIYKLKEEYVSWDKCLGNLGRIYKDARCDLETKHNFTKRQYVAAPIIVQNEVTPPPDLSRRAKQLFLNVIKNNNKYQGYIIFLDSKEYAPKYISKDINNNTYLQVCKEMKGKLAKQMEVII